ncbi:hypothetical protein D3C77_424800 [compost metagenome]
MRIVVGISAADVYDVAFRRLIDYRLGLKLTDTNVIKGNIVVDFRIIDQAVIRDNLDAFLMCLFNDRCGRFRVMRHDDEYIDALRDKLFRLAKLDSIIPVRGQHFHFTAKLLYLFRENIPVLLPTLLFQRIQGQSDDDFTFAFACGGISGVIFCIGTAV